MTIQRGPFELVCDNCGDTESLDTRDFEDAKEEANRLEEEEGWATVKRGTVYKHLCAACGNGG